MTRWTARGEREAIVAHVSRCRFCQALLVHGRCRRDRELLDAAEALASEHAENDAERAMFAHRVWRRASVSAERQDRACALGRRERR